MEFLRKNQTSLEVAALVAAILLYLSQWLSFFMIWPDSAIYLTAAMNFVRHGAFFIYANFPSGSVLPQTEVYADYPPGFAAYLAFFYFFLRDPILTAVVAQSLALAAFAWLTYFTARAIRLALPWRLCVVFFFLLFPPFRVISYSLLNEILYMSLSMACFLACLGLCADPRRKRPLAIALVSLASACAIRWNGVANAIFFLFPIFLHLRGFRRYAAIFAAGIFSLLPTLLWFFRNSLYFRKTTPMHDFSRLPIFSWGKIMAPFENLGLRWGFGHFWVFLLLLAFALSPVIRKRGDRVAGMLLAGAGAQLLVIYVMTLLVSVTALDDRYLAPSYLFFAFSLFLAANTYTQHLNLWRHATALAIAFLLLGCAGIAWKRESLARHLQLSLATPQEYFLWRELAQRSYVARATHYFTDDNYLHQIFFEKPQRLIFTNRLREPDFESKVKDSGSYFFVVEKGSEVQHWAERSFHLRQPFLAREDIGKFVVYYKN